MNRAHNHSRLTDITPYQPVRTISAVIPTLNEGGHIRECIESVLKQPRISEVIVSDSGSTDNTGVFASKSGAQVIQSRHRGRGFQIFDGISHTSGDAILTIHADCRLTKGASNRLLTTLNTNPTLAGGAFGMSFSSRMYRLASIALLNNLRARFTGISFGDQGQFFRREALAQIGGFPRQMLMEDVELSLRLRSVGGIAFLPRGILVSARRWNAQPFTSHTVQVLGLFARYLLARRNGCIEKITGDYYKQYYS